MAQNRLQIAALVGRAPLESMPSRLQFYSGNGLPVFSVGSDGRFFNEVELHVLKRKLRARAAHAFEKMLERGERSMRSVKRTGDSKLRAPAENPNAERCFDLPEVLVKRSAKVRENRIACIRRE